MVSVSEHMLLWLLTSYYTLPLCRCRQYNRSSTRLLHTVIRLFRSFFELLLPFNEATYLATLWTMSLVTKNSVKNVPGISNPLFRD